MNKQCQFPLGNDGHCTSLEYNPKYKDLEEKLKLAVELLKELDTDFESMEHSYIGRGSNYHKRIKGVIRGES